MMILIEYILNPKAPMKWLRESLLRSLLLGASIEELKPGPTQQSASHSNRKLANHKLEEKEGSIHNVGKRCTDSYMERGVQQSRAATYAAAKAAVDH